jgi:hypothetical protein
MGEHEQSQLNFLRSAAYIIGCLCEDSELRQLPNTDAFYDPLLHVRVRNAQCNKIVEFLCCCQDTAKWSLEVNVVAIIFAARFSRKQPVTHHNWERVLLASLMIAQKMVDDCPLCKCCCTHRTRTRSIDYSDANFQIFRTHTQLTRTSPKCTQFGTSSIAEGKGLFVAARLLCAI